MADAYQQLIDQLSDRRHVLITTHVRPDGDALGSTAALHLALKHKGIASEVLLLSHLPTKYAFVFNDPGVPFHDAEKKDLAAMDFSRYDCLLVADTGTWNQLPGLKPMVEHLRIKKLVLDHHLTQEDWADHKLVVKDAAAAGEIVAELLDRWNVPLAREIATSLYVAIASDTGWFQFSNTSPSTMRLAAKLMEAGVNTDELYQNLYQNERPERLRVQAIAMASLEMLAGNRLAVMTLSKRDLQESNANVNDTENLINIPLMVRPVEVSILIIEPRDVGPIRVSLRSKGQIDVSKFAEQFGGGGHARASGLKLETTLSQAHEQVVAAMLKAIGKG
jgi:phosphoesterase RecJ-like protein